MILVAEFQKQMYFLRHFSIAITVSVISDYRGIALKV